MRDAWNRDARCVVRVCMDQELRTETVLPLPRDEVFAFFSAAENLERITPPELKFKIVTPLPIAMREGALIDYQLGLGGVSFGWRTLITKWEPPMRFVDVQLKGPYAVWEHTHEFDEVPGGTRLRDQVRYRLPFGVLGLVALPVVRWQVGRIFAYREEVIRRLLPG